MIVESVELKNFRNYRELKLLFDEKTNIFYGDNAQGKTNILEAVYLSGTTKSHKGSRDRDMIYFGEEEAHLRTFVKKRELEYQIDIHLKKNKAKGIAINGVPIRKASELFGIANFVFFSPEDLSIIKQGPAERRRFLDMELCQLDKVYLHQLSGNRFIDQGGRDHSLNGKPRGAVHAAHLARFFFVIFQIRHGDFQPFGRFGTDQEIVLSAVQKADGFVELSPSDWYQLAEDHPRIGDNGNLRTLRSDVDDHGTFCLVDRYSKRQRICNGFVHQIHPAVFQPPSVGDRVISTFLDLRHSRRSGKIKFRPVPDPGTAPAEQCVKHCLHHQHIGDAPVGHRRDDLNI